MADYIPTEHDLPLDTEAGEDLPLDTENFIDVKTRPKVIDDMYRGHAAVLKAELEETHVFDAYDALDPTEDPKLMVNQLSAQRSQESQKDLQDYFNENLGSTPEDVIQSAETYKELQAEEVARATPERQVAETFAGLSPDEQELKRVEAELMLINSLTEMVTDYTPFEKAVDMAKAFLPTTLLDNKQMTDQFFFADDYLRDVIIGMKDMSRNDPDKFKAILPVLMEQMDTTLPKNKQIQILAAIQDPRGEEELGMFSNLDAVLDLFDVVPLGIGLATSAVRLTKRANAIRLAVKLNNKELATDINTAVLADETGNISKKTGIDKESAYNNASPFNTADLDDSYVAGLSTTSIAKIQEVKAYQQKVSEIIRNKQGLLKETALSTGERLAAEEKVYKQMKQLGMDNINIIDRTDAGSTFKYSSINPETNEVITDIKTVPMTIDARTGVWTHTEQGMIASYLKSPTVFAKNAAEDVDAALRLDSSSAVVGSMFKKMQTDALAPILGGKFSSIRPKTRRQLAELDAVLMAGDQFKDVNGVRGKLYTVDELRGGVVNGVQLADNQIEAYYNLRNLYDELWTIRNSETRQTLMSKGMQEVRVGHKPAVGKPYTQEGAVGFMNTKGTLKVWDATKGETVDLKATDVADLYKDNKQVSSLQEAMKPDGLDELYDVVITHADDIGDLPQKVLHFKEGYVPKVNKGSYWFVKEVGNRTVNGVTHTNQALKTRRMFTSKTEAARWLSSQEDAAKLTLLPDRALEQKVMGSSQVGAGGGLYTGARSSEDIPFGTDGLPAERMNTYEALAQNLQSLENYVTRNQWRMGMQQKWINSAKAAGFPEVDTFNKKDIPEGDPRGVGLRKLADQIEVWSGFPTRSEQVWDGFISGVMEWGLNSRFVPLKDKTVVRGANFLRDTNPVNLIRASAFHSLLGIFNPAQLWVQAQGFSVAASLTNKPLEAFRIQTALSVAQWGDKSPDAIRLLADRMAINPDDFTNLVKAWRMSGLEDSTLNTADHAAAVKGFGVAGDAVRRTFDKGLLLYRMGELFNRRFSFVVAAERKARTKGHYNFSNDEVKELLSDANHMMLNLSKANKAGFQHGAMSVPTQFLQVQAKFIETMSGANRNFTVAERGRILAGQVALYGSAGVPLGSLGVRYLQEVLGYTQEDMENLDEDIVTTVNNGLWGVFATNWLGADVSLASRGAIAAGMTEFTMDLMFSEASMGEKVMGAFGTVPHRFFKAYKTIKPMMLSDSEQPFTSEEFLLGLNAIASISSTWSNARKAWFMNQMHQLNDSRGNAIQRNKDFNIETEAAVLLGFQPMEAKHTRDRENLVRARKQYRSDITNDLLTHYWDYVTVLKGADSEREKEKIIERYSAGTRVLMSSLKNEGERRKVMEALNAKLMNPTDRRTKSIKAFIEEFSDGQVLELGNMVAAATADGIIQNGLSTKEDQTEQEE